MDNDALRKLWREYHAMTDKVFGEWERGGYQHPPPRMPPMPEALKGLTCGAKTRAATPCKRKDLYSNGRCRLHGGLSTGPVTRRARPSQL